MTEDMRLSLSDLLLLPLTLPINGFVFILEQLRDAADRELYDPETIGRRIVALQLQYEMEEIGEDEYRDRLAELSARMGAGAS